MKKTFRIIVLAAAVVAGCLSSRAQYYQIANQLPQMLSPALSGSMNYKGYVEASGLAGFGNNRANFLGISTSQGFRYADWFFMGVGMGIDVAMAHQEDGPLYDNGNNYPNYYGGSTSKTKAMIPVFTDFRFNIGGMSSPSFFIDLKVGAAWLIGDSYLEFEDAYMTTGTQFYLRPSLGIRIPVDRTNTSRAFNIGVTYQLLTSNNSYYWYNNNSVLLNNFGVTLGYEW